MSIQLPDDPKAELRDRLDELEALIAETENPELRAIYRSVYEQLRAREEGGQS